MIKVQEEVKKILLRKHNVFFRDKATVIFAASNFLKRGLYARKDDLLLYFLFIFNLIWIIHTFQVIQASSIFFRSFFCFIFISLFFSYLNILPSSHAFQNVKSLVYLKYVLLINFQYAYLAI